MLTVSIGVLSYVEFLQAARKRPVNWYIWKRKEVDINSCWLVQKVGVHLRRKDPVFLS